MTNDRTGTVAANGLRAAARTDCGRQRAENEDLYFVDLDSGVFLVIDGVGGHAAGEVAARIAHDTILKRLERQDAAADVRIREAITLANQQILLQAQESPARKGMACVLTLGLLEGRRLTVGHVGDTRLYRFSPDGIAKMTHDHSPVGEREDAREISETEAMQHARRNEVYRDVGSEPREPDAAEFIEIVVTSVDDEVALLLCSDGLSDMLSSLEINRIVRQHAGDPARVADALVDAANQAGGKDNITVLYVEAPRFAKSAGPARVVPMARQPPKQVATEALDGFNGDAPVASPSDPGARAGAASPGVTGGSFLRGRTRTLLLGGVLLGAAVALALSRYPIAGFALPAFLGGPRETTPAGPRELIVGGTAAGSFPTIGEALRQARDGDVVRVAPGRYPETLELRRAVTLISDQPHAAALVVPPNEASWASLTVWTNGAVVRGFRIPNEGSPGHAGVRVHADVEIDDVVFEGAMAVGVDAAGRGSQAIVRGSRFMELSGVPVQIGDEALVTLRHNHFRAAARATGPAVACASSAGLILDSNTFMHFPGPPVVCATGPAVVIDPRFVVPPPAAPRGRRR